MCQVEKLVFMFSESWYLASPSSQSTCYLLHFKALRLCGSSLFASLIPWRQIPYLTELCPHSTQNIAWHIVGCSKHAINVCWFINKDLWSTYYLPRHCACCVRWVVNLGWSLHTLYTCLAVAGEAQWIECWPANWRLASLIPSHGTCLGFRPGPQLGVCERQPIDVPLTHQGFSPSLSPSLPLCLKINK